MNEMLDTRSRDKAVATWLLVCCGLVFAMVVLGGVTRLTGSGLSMAEWRPIMGTLPPLSDAEWQRVFEIYQQTPEFQKVNSHMDVHDFKGIFWLEYLHRLLGRLLGLAFLLPLLFFVARKYITWSQLPWYLLMFALGGIVIVAGFAFDHGDFAAALMAREGARVPQTTAVPDWRAFLAAAAVLFASFIGTIKTL